MKDRELPKIIKKVGFDFNWDETKVWKLDVQAEDMPIEELKWHFSIPFLWTKPSGFYDLTPQEVIDNPTKHSDEFNRTMKSDESFPIDIMFWRGRWLILDGLHRLMKQAIKGEKVVRVRKISESMIPKIRKED